MKIKYLLGIIVSFLLISNVFAHDDGDYKDYKYYRSATPPMTAYPFSNTACKIVNLSGYKAKVKIVLKNGKGRRVAYKEMYLKKGHAAYVSYEKHESEQWYYCRFQVWGADIHNFPAAIQNFYGLNHAPKLLKLASPLFYNTC